MEDVDDDAECSEANFKPDVTPTIEAQVTSVNVETEHELLRVEGKINGRRALMLIDSGSTHDFIAEQFARRVNLPTEIGSENLNVTLADGASSSFPMETTHELKVIVGDFSDNQTFTVFPLHRYDAILGKPWLTRNNPDINFRTNEVRLNSNGLPCASPSQSEPTAPVEAMFISGRQARHALRSGDEGVLAWVSVEDGIGKEPDKSTQNEHPDLKAMFRDYDDLFPDDLPARLPPERSVDHEIRLEEGSSPPSRPAYRLPRPEMEELKKQLTELLKKGFVEPSKSPFGAPVFFVKKADGSLRMVCDWRELNKITVKNKACLPNVDDLFDTVQGARYFTKLDLRSGYNQIRIQAEDVPKTAINTPFGHYQFRVMGFGLTNAPATFQSMMNTILQPYLREFVVVFLDDILIFSKTWSEHMQHVRSVLSVLRDNQLFCKRSKCEFGVESVRFLGHCIDGLHIAPDPDKIAAVKVWPAPTSVTEVRQFLGFTNYFRRFIDQYSSLSKNLEEITGKHARFEWNSSRQHAFESLKHALLNAPLLRLADVNRPFRVVTDASDFALGCVLLQELEEDAWHPVAYASRKLSAAEQNYTATERETLAVVFALKTWRIYLFQHFEVITDNMAVVYLKTKPSITKREARWVEFLADYNYTVRHRPGRENPADPLSRRPDLHESNLVENAVPRLNAIEYALAMNDDVSNTISDAYQRDKELTPIIERLKHSLRDNLHDRYYWDESTDRLYLKASPNNRLCIPQCGVRLKLIQEHHECATAGHPGRDRTYFRLARFFYWPRMGLDIKRFVKTCDLCQRTKGGQPRTGLLQSLPIPNSPWQDISMDFIVGLPLTSRGFDAIYTFVDRLTKCVHLVPTNSKIDAKGSAQLYIQNVFRLHGLSSTIVSDRDPRFTAAFFKEVFSQLGTKLAFSTANHPQTDGLTERVNRQVGDVLRAFVNLRQDNWDSLLPLCEFAINSSQQSSVANTPFYLNYGFDPKSPPEFILTGGERSDSVDWLHEQEAALRIARDAMLDAQARQALYADQMRTPSDLKVGDSVLVYRDFLLTPEARGQPSRKLQPKWFGPYRIQAKIGANAFRLELPRELRCHPVFNVTALKRYEENTIPGRHQPPPPPFTDLDGHTRYVVEAVLNHRHRSGEQHFLVHWKGYPSSEATWEPAGNLCDESGRNIKPLQNYLASQRQQP